MTFNFRYYKKPFLWKLIIIIYSRIYHLNKLIIKNIDLINKIKIPFNCNVYFNNKINKKNLFKYRINCSLAIKN